MQFFKYHALGNDYIVIEKGEVRGSLSPKQIIRICHRNFGVGSDGILLHESDRLLRDHFHLTIFNPDGSEAEKSGNGLRIFARYLWDQKRVSSDPFHVETAGGRVRCVVLDGGKTVSVEMGKVSFQSKDIPVLGDAREVLREKLNIQGESLEFCAATIGNPHCVILRKATEEEAKKFGPDIENNHLFPKRTNVQFLEVLDKNNIRIEIWERGAGYTLASGSSSSAAACVAKKLGFCESPITVHMPGGKILIEIDDDFAVTMTGPVAKVCEGKLSEEIF